MRRRVRCRVDPAGLPCVPSCRTGGGVWVTRGGHDLRRTAHSAPAATSAVATTTNGQTGMSPLVPLAPAPGPGVPVPGTVSRNDQDPDTTWPSAEVTR